jgi:hypothetical protein
MIGSVKITVGLDCPDGSRKDGISLLPKHVGLDNDCFDRRFFLTFESEGTSLSRLFDFVAHGPKVDGAFIDGTLN